jgi:hypothetical protein
MLKALYGTLLHKTKKGPTRLTDSNLYERVQNIKNGPIFRPIVPFGQSWRRPIEVFG